MSRINILIVIFITSNSLSKILLQNKGFFNININNNFSNIHKLLNISQNHKNKTNIEKVTKIRKLLTNNIDDSIILKESDNEGKNSAPHIVFELFDSFALFIYLYNLTDLLENEDVETCFYDGIIDNILYKPLIDIYIDGSGKSLNDFGNEFVCNYNVRRNVSYMTLHFFLGTPELKNDKEEFFGQEYFYIGLCLPKKCEKAAKFLVHNDKVMNITHESGLSNVKLYINEDIVNLSTELSPFYSILINIYIGLNILKLLIGIWRIIFLNKGYEGYYAEIEINEKEKEKKGNLPDSDGNNNEQKNNQPVFNVNKSLENGKDASFTYTSDISEDIIDEGENLYNPISDKEKYFPVYLKILKIFDLFDNLKILSSNSNKYYNSSRIKSLYILRFLLMIMSIIQQIMYIQIDLPSKNYFNGDFYSSYTFVLIKLCINASTFWITLDAVIFGYKLMSFLKKEIKLSVNFEIKYIKFLKFLLLTFPKFFIFLLAFLILHLNAYKLTFELCKGNKVFSNYLYYNDTVQQASYSLRNNNGPGDFFKHFIPFRLNYIDFIEDIKIERSNDNHTNYTTDVSGYEIPSPFLKNTDLFVNVCFNEFYLIILMVNISYFSYKIRNKYFDFSILIINFILYLFPLIGKMNPYRGDITEQDYNFRYVLGQNYSEKYTHYFINFFYFGFLIGVMKFYHEENIYYMKKKKNIFQKKFYLPFEFCKIIITKLSKLKFIVKRIILIGCIILLLIISLSYNLIQRKNISPDYPIKLEKIRGIIKFLFYYEKNLSGIFFFIFLMAYIVYPKNTYIKNISSSTIFIVLERISFSFYLCFVYLIYAQFCVFVMDMPISYPNLTFNITGMFFIIFVFSLLNTALFELPVRQLIKYIMNRNLESSFLIFFDKFYSNSSSGITDDNSSIGLLKED